jgi:rhomboid protease GluP
MFLLQNYWQDHAGSSQELFIRMGALAGVLVERGDWWRMISVGFLHGGVMHVGMNGFVLYLLGGQMERVLGSGRFLILYTLALVGGSFASMQFGGGLSVGASGAIWGLLGGQVSLAYRRPALLPKSMAEGLRPLVKQNIILNLGISLLPFIDAAAHLGGGITGAAVLWFGLLYPKSEDQTEANAATESPETPVWLNVLAVACAFLLFYGVVTALRMGRPWETFS